MSEEDIQEALNILELSMKCKLNDNQIMLPERTVVGLRDYLISLEHKLKMKDKEIVELTKKLELLDDTMKQKESTFKYE